MYHCRADNGGWSSMLRENPSDVEPAREDLVVAPGVRLEVLQADGDWKMVRAGDGTFGWLRSMHLARQPPPAAGAAGCASALAPAHPVPPATIVAALEVPRSSQPAVAQTPMPLWQLQGVASRHEAFSFTLSDQQRCMELNRRAHAHLDEFDWDMPPQQHTSALMRHIRFPTPNVSKPIPVTCGSLPGFGEEEWERYDIDTCEGLQKEVKFQTHWWNNENMSERTFYHGAPFGAVVGMIAAGGFIPGPGKCRKGSRRVSGCFCSTDFGDAFSKGTFHQLDFAEVKAKANGDKALNIFCMPCVVEIWPVDLVPPTYMHGNKYCFEPAPDSPACQNVLPGVAIKHVFINRFLFQNFLFHHSFPDLSNPLQRRICGQNKSRFTTKDVYQATCGLILESDTKTHVSRTGIWYCRSCTDLHVNHSDHITFARR